MPLPLSIRRLANENTAQTADYSAPERRRVPTALTSGNLLHVDTELETAVSEAEAEVKGKEDAEARELRQIAALADHPGWITVRRLFEDRILEYRSGRIIGEALANPKVSDAEVGAMVRNTNLVAGELTALINKVELAALDDQRQREEMRNATIRERVAART